MISSSLLVFTSCENNEIKTPTDASFDAKYETYYRIASFVEKMQGKEVSYPVLIPRTDYSPTQTRDYIEGAMNLQYTDPGLTWEDYDEDSETFTISLAGGVASEATVEALFDDVTEFASLHFYAIGEEDKFPYLYDATIISSGTSSMQLEITSVVGLRHRDPTPFGETDYWSVFEEGLCSPSDDPSSLTAAKLQNDALNDWFTPYSCGLWTEVHNIGTDALKPYGWEADNPTETGGDWIIDFRSFVVECEPSEECSEFDESGIFCLAPNDMNYYFQSIVSIYEDFAEAEDLSMRMSDFGLLDQDYGSYIRYYWTGSNRWGVRNDCIEGGPFPYALPQCC